VSFTSLQLLRRYSFDRKLGGTKVGLGSTERRKKPVLAMCRTPALRPVDSSNTD
jgi:hypothetical protein